LNEFEKYLTKYPKIFCSFLNEEKLYFDPLERKSGAATNRASIFTQKFL
jgi:hypothetical protein